jgi:hypothetical protein
MSMGELPPTGLARVSFRHPAAEGAVFLPTVVEALLGRQVTVEVSLGGLPMELISRRVIGGELIEGGRELWVTVESDGG